MKKLIAAAVFVLLIMNTGCFHRTAAVDEERLTLYLSGEGRIISLSYEEYLTGCIFGWMALSEQPPSALNGEAVRAVAVAANTLARYHLDNTPKSTFCGAELSDGAACQPYLTAEAAGALYGSSYPVYLEQVRSAVQYGLSHTLMHEGQPIYAAMCAASTGLTEGDSTRPYLTARECPDTADACDAYSADTIRRMLTQLTGVSRVSADPAEWFSMPVYTEGGALAEIRFCGARVTGGQLRELFSLRSAAVTVEYSEERFLLHTRGVGDNLGMSISAAAAMSEDGSTAVEILSYFYSPAVLSNS